MHKKRDSTNKFAKDVALNELTKRGLSVERDGRHLLVNQQRVHVRGCNYDNSWAKRAHCFGGWDKLNPERFDYLICISFDEDFNNVRCFVFTSKEAQEFPLTTLAGREFGLKNLTLFRNDQDSESIRKSSEDTWDKIL